MRKLHFPVAEDSGSSAMHVRREPLDPDQRAGDWSVAYLALGSNLGHRRRNLSQAIARLGFERPGDGLRVTAVSGVYETDPVGGPDNQDPYLNLVIEIETTLDPFELLERCQATEAAGGRKRTVRWGPRTIDVDVLLYSDVHIDTTELTLPHPRMWERRFVLEPLADVAPERLPADWSVRLPVSGINRVDDLSL